jgi:hypothetical protein
VEVRPLDRVHDLWFAGEMLSPTAMRALTLVSSAAAAVACGDDETPLGTTTGGGMAAAGHGGADGGGGSGANGGFGGNPSSSGGMGGMGFGGAPEGYPEGPYGHNVGDTFPYLEWEGYVKTDPATLATAETWTPDYDSLDVYDSDAPWAMVHTSLTG